MSCARQLKIPMPRLGFVDKGQQPEFGCRQEEMLFSFVMSSSKAKISRRGSCTAFPPGGWPDESEPLFPSTGQPKNIPFMGGMQRSFYTGIESGQDEIYSLIMPCIRPKPWEKSPLTRMNDPGQMAMALFIVAQCPE